MTAILNNKQKNSQQQSFSTRKTQIHYDIYKNEQASANIICLHGLASNATRWKEYLAESHLKDHCNMMAMDLFGHGRSLSFRSYTRKNWCDDVETLIHSLENPSIIIGHSLGAQIALDLAQRHELPIKGIVLIDPVFPEALSGILKKVSRFRSLLWLIIKIIRGFNLFGLHKRHYPARDLNQLDLQTRQFLKDNPDKTISDLYMKPTADLKYIPLVNYLQDLFEVTRPLLPLKNIKTRVLVLLSKGASTSNVDANKKILSNIEQLETEIIDADHWLLTEKPVEARKVIDNWCEKILHSS